MKERVTVAYIPTTEMPADGFTKALPKPAQQKSCRAKLWWVPPLQEELADKRSNWEADSYRPGGVWESDCEVH